jgi:hypothetical protein
MLTVLLTGLWVRSPSARRGEPPVPPPRAEQPVASDRGAELPPVDPGRAADEPAQELNEPDSPQGTSGDQAAQRRDSTSDRAAEAPR